MYTGKGLTIDVETVEKLVPRSLEQNIFTLVEKIVSRQIQCGIENIIMIF